MIDWLILLTASFLAGALNAVAGGGSFLTFPALVFIGIPAVAANATSAVAVFPGYLGAAAGFRAEIFSLDGKLLRRYLLTASAGGLVGSLLLLVTTNEAFNLLVPWLLLFATLLFGLGEKIMKFMKHAKVQSRPLETLLLFAVSLYGGYFNGGLGIILLALFLFLGFTDLNVMNGLKNGISFCISVVSVITFSAAGLVRWPEACVMMVAATCGGYAGAVWAKKIPPRWLRAGITVVGLGMSLIFFLRI